MKYKYIRSLVTGAGQLYDLDRDPSERNNIAASAVNNVRKAEELLAEHKEQVQQLRKRHSIEAKKIELDKDTIRQLKSLGYIR